MITSVTNEHPIRCLERVVGKVIGDCMPQHRHEKFIFFLKRIDTETHLHFTPTSSSWLNLVERWFRDLTEQRIRRGSFHAVKELITTIEDYIENHNQKPQVFGWSASVERILSKIAKCKEVLDAVH